MNFNFDSKLISTELSNSEQGFANIFKKYYKGHIIVSSVYKFEVRIQQIFSIRLISLVGLTSKIIINSINTIQIGTINNNVKIGIPINNLIT